MLALVGMGIISLIWALSEAAGRLTHDINL